jgi:hypothetical protein
MRTGGVREAAAEALTAWHRQGLRFFRDAQGHWTVRTVEELSAPPETAWFLSGLPMCALLKYEPGIPPEFRSCIGTRYGFQVSGT